MADEKKTGTDTKPDEKTGGDGTFKVGDLKNFIREEIAAAVEGIGGKKEDTKTTDSKADDKTGGMSVADQVKAQLASLKAKEDREKREQTIDQQLKELAEKTKEKAPIERRRVHKIMGWGEPAE